MSNFPEIENYTYHNMSFSEIDEIRKKVISGEIALLVNNKRSMLYLNQMLPKYRYLLILIQNLNII